ncbi:hypothetical protein LSAT2_001823 [Lamellibrachia satsuma]|nr:hypothetical protein LSAT2_001823 [Lamellibrachia satsuma]
MRAIATALSRCPKVEKLRLTENDLSDPTASKALGDSIQEMTALRELGLQKCGIATDGMRAIATALSRCPKVEKLRLTENDLSDPTANKALGDSIQEMTALRELGLQECGIDAEAMLSVAEALQHCAKVESLFLGKNNLSHQEVGEALSRSIRCMTSLRDLRLQECGIDAEAILSVAEALQHCAKVERLVLGNNNLSDEEAGHALGRSLSCMTSLRDLISAMSECLSVIPVALGLGALLKDQCLWWMTPHL